MEREIISQQEAIFAAGCFWGVESFFRKVPGVIETTVGYSGGQTENPSYEMVCTGKTGHAEAVKVIYDAQLIDYEKLVRIFFKNHDPTTPNRQGRDIGNQYRSAIFYANEKEKIIAERVKNELNQSEQFHSNKIVTEISPAINFYPAEEYHQRYFEKMGIAGVCHL